MNRDKPEKTDKPCNVCETGVVEVGSAWSRCSNRSCITRRNGNNLSTDSTAEEQAEYWEKRAREAEKQTALTREQAEEEALRAFANYIRAESRADAEETEIRADVYLDHTDKGWGWLKEESDAV
jgi:hypothetical protein